MNIHVANPPVAQNDPGAVAAPNSRQKILMCAPDHFGVNYVINPWMLGNRGRINHALAVRQWNNLRDAVAAHAEITLIEPQPNLPDMVFTANAGMVLGKLAVASRFRYSARQGERFFANGSSTMVLRCRCGRRIFFSKVPAMPCSIAASLLSGADFAFGPMKLRPLRTNAFSNAPSSVCGLSIRAFTISTPVFARSKVAISSIIPRLSMPRAGRRSKPESRRKNGSPSPRKMPSNTPATPSILTGMFFSTAHRKNCRKNCAPPALRLSLCLCPNSCARAGAPSA